MALSFMIIFFVIIFTLFTFFICCYGSEEEKRRNRYYQPSYPRNSFENVSVPPFNPTSYRNPNPTNIGFNVTTTDGPSRIIPPVGVIPSAPNTFPSPYPPENVTPYPPVQAPYPITDSQTFPQPQTTTSRPSAPVEDNSQPPSYYEATQHKY
ncbi:proline-rich receptor-like protein kinase PERK2 [Coccinella septempunctata]|uniref:proline-rich receptor-like protein kinase PERK2 n=1 Tax=Coccinella septempunctata TaxID=41139 RepID=UPI001D0786D9|nr:proline-rich receptor-like protein kinase PERK2 [Coccinella septempunctata]XP_044746841.1 proline-rich receptor-like protein kinase PERK2 [Coccinella septempunctata]